MGILSTKMSTVQPSQTKAMSALAETMVSQGRKVIKLSQGEPDFATPEHIAQAAISAIVAGHTKYTAVAGIPLLREAIVDKFKRENALTFSMEQVTVGCGAKQLLFNALIASLDAGDEIVFPTPCWVSYPEMVKLAGGVPVAIKTLVEDGFVIQPDTLEAAITPNTKWLMLNSPSNPTGAVYSRADLAALAEVLRKHPKIWVLSDDIYEHIVYNDDAFATLAAIAADLADRTVTINGVSKSYAMTGWRVGYAGGPTEMIKAMNTVQGQSTSHTCSIAQHAAAAALSGDQSFIGEFRDAFKVRRDLMMSFLHDIPGLNCRTPDGAFYLFVDCRSLMGSRAPDGKQLNNDNDFAMYLLEHAGVAVVPGSAFLAEGFVRISYAASDDELRSACRQIRHAVAELSNTRAA